MSEDAGAVQAGRLYLDVIGDTTGLKDDLKAKLAALSQQLKIQITAQVNVQAADAKRQLDTLAKDRKVKVAVSADTTAAKAALDETAQDRTAKITAKADTTAARADLDTAARDRTTTIKAKADTGTLESSIESVGQKLVSIGTKTLFAAGITEAVAAAGNLAGALVAVIGAASQAAGVIGALPGLLSAAVQAGGVVKLGFSGISGALKDMSAQQASVGQSAYSMAQAQQGAADRVRAATQGLQAAQLNAVQSVAQAQHSLAQDITATADAQYNAIQTMAGAEHTLAEAQYGEQQAQIALTQAREDARQNLIQTSFALRGATIGEAQATLNLQAAQIKLANTMQSVAATPTQRTQAQLDVRQAQLALDEAGNQQQQAAAAKAKADKAGVAGSQSVVQAKHSEADATYSVAQAEQTLARDRITTQRAVADAEYTQRQAAQSLVNTQRQAAQQLANAQITYREAVEAAHAPTLGLTSQATALSTAMDALSPAGRRFVTFLHDQVLPQLHEVKQAVQEAFLPGVQAGVSKALPVIGTVQKGLVGTGKVLGAAASKFGGYLGSSGVQTDISSVMATNTKAIGLFADAGQHAFDILRNIMVAAEPLELKIAGAADRIVKALDDASKAGRKSGGLADFFSRAYDAAATLGHIVVNVGEAIGHIFHAGEPAGASLLGSLERATKTFADWTGSSGGQAKMAAFFENTIPVAKQVGDALIRIVKLVASLANSMGGGQYNVLFAALNTLLTVLTAISKVPGLGTVLNYLLAFGAASVGIGKVAGNIGKVTDGLSKLTKIPGLGKLLDATGISGGIESLGTKLKSKGSVGATLGSKVKGLGSKILGTAPVAVDRPGADRVFSVGADGEAAATDLDEAGSGVIAGTGLRGLASKAGGALSTAGGKAADVAAAGFARMGAAASKAGALVTDAMSGASTWLGTMAGKVNFAAIKTALLGVQAKITAAATKVWAGIQAAFNLIMDANPIVLVGIAIAALVAGIIYAYIHFKTFRDGVNDVFHAVAGAALWLWHDVFDPVWHGISAGAELLYNNGIRPWLNLTVAEIRFVQAAALWLWHNVFDPMWQGLKAGAEWFYNNAIKRYLDLTVGEIRFLQGAVLWLWHNVFDPMWEGLVSGAKNATSGLSQAWSKIKNIFDAPVKWVIDFVYNDGIVKVWDAVAGLVGLKQLKPIKGFSRGGVTPGYEPGRDSQVIAVGGGEGILVPEAVRGIGGASAVDALNYQFAGHRGAGKPNSGPGFSHGGNVPPGLSIRTGITQNPTGAPGLPNLIGDAGALVKKGLHVAGSLTEKVAQAAGGLLLPVVKGFVHSVIDPLLKKMPYAGTQVGKALTGIPDKLVDALLAKVSGYDSGGGSGTGGQIVQYAKQFIGKLPYVWGGTSLSTGSDCSGFSEKIYEHFGYHPPRTSEQQWQWVQKTSRPQVGGLAFFAGSDGTKDNPGHVGIISGPDQMIDEYSTGFKAQYNNLKTDSGPVTGYGVPPGGFHAAAAAAGMLPANAAAIASFLRGRGFTKAATAGILGNIWQESKGNPGIGLIQILGDAGGSLSSELAKTMAYINANGSVADINAHSPDATAAAVYFSDAYERPGIPMIQNRIASAEASFAAGYDQGGPVHPGANWLLNGTGRDEWVLVPEAVDLLGGPGAVARLNQTARVARSAAAQSAAPAAAASRTGVSKAEVNVYPQPRQSEEEIGAVAARKLGVLLAG